MRTVTAILSLLISTNMLSQKTSPEPNEIVGFLAGDWHTYSFSIADKAPVGRQDYAEKMRIKNAETLTITALGYKDGEDLTRDMILILRDDNVVMKQGNFVAEGKKEGNLYSLTGQYGEKEYRFRLYTLGDKYVFHREVWADGEVEKMDMSYLVRKK